MSKKQLVKLAILLIGGALMAEYLPEPKPQRIVVGVTNGNSNNAEDGDTVGFWKPKIDRMLPDRPDLIVLPEAANQVKGVRNGIDPKLREYMVKTARENRCNIAFPCLRDLGGNRFANSLELIDRNGETVAVYDKNFTTIPEIKSGRIVGKKIKPIPTDIGKIVPLICWDLNFYKEMPLCFTERPQLTVFASRYHGGLIQRFWAYESRSYFIGAFAFGQCTVINPVGEIVAQTTNYTDTVTAQINLDYQVVHIGDGNMPKLRKLKAKYGRGVTIFDPGHLGPALVTSELKDISSKQMIEEFGISTWDDYYRRCVEADDQNREK